MVVSLYNAIARYAHRGEIRWKGLLAHVIETSAPCTPIITAPSQRVR